MRAGVVYRVDKIDCVKHHVVVKYVHDEGFGIALTCKHGNINAYGIECVPQFVGNVTEVQGHQDCILDAFK